MANETQTTVEPNLDVIVLEGTEVRLPRRLELPAHVDTTGRVWPVGGITRATRIPVATMLDAGVTVQWKLPDGTVLDQETGSLLVLARQADMDSGYQPTFADAPVPADPPTQGPESA